MKPEERFSNRVSDYLSGRPGYPDAAVFWLTDTFELAPPAMIADIGAGTGISAALLISHGFDVVAIEPNDAMREAAIERLGADPQFRAVAASAEATTLPDASMDAVIAAQAFHWFDRPKFRAECLRILKPLGVVALFWNVRRAKGDDFAQAYEALLREFGTDYLAVRHENVADSELAAFFGGTYECASFENVQELDRESLRSRLLSSSYIPAEGAPRHEEMLAALDRLFDEHERDGTVDMVYDLFVYASRPI